VSEMMIYQDVFETFTEAASAIRLFKLDNPQYKTYEEEIQTHEYEGEKCYTAIVYDDAY
jgi:hypothetical protein